VKNKLKYLFASYLVVLALLSLLIITNSAQQPLSDQDHWLQLAKNAWAYFQPGKGVNAQTGLHMATLDYSYFTDWDLGLYIQTIMDAEKLGIVNAAGAWGSDDRIDKLLIFLETRQLTLDGVSCARYNSRTGAPDGNANVNPADTGKLLVALQNLKNFKPALASRIDAIVYNRTNYEPNRLSIDDLVSSNATYNRLDLYDYYILWGYSSFWPDRYDSETETVLTNILSSATVQTYNVSLPTAKMNSEIALHIAFELPPDPRTHSLVQQIYFAQEARFQATGKYTAWSEGNTALQNPTYLYEWVVYPDGRTWITLDPKEADASTAPILYFKAAVGFMALYNATYARDTVRYLESRLPNAQNGYMEGIDENGRVVATVSDKTNGLIVSAAAYVLASNLTATPEIMRLSGVGC